MFHVKHVAKPWCRPDGTPRSSVSQANHAPTPRSPGGGMAHAPPTSSRRAGVGQFPDGHDLPPSLPPVGPAERTRPPAVARASMAPHHDTASTPFHVSRETLAGPDTPTLRPRCHRNPTSLHTGPPSSAGTGVRDAALVEPPSGHGPSRSPTTDPSAPQGSCQPRLSLGRIPHGATRAATPRLGLGLAGNRRCRLGGRQIPTSGGGTLDGLRPGPDATPRRDRVRSCALVGAPGSNLVAPPIAPAQGDLAFTPATWVLGAGKMRGSEPGAPATSPPTA